jgi:hypothetical protein
MGGTGKQRLPVLILTRSIIEKQTSAPHGQTPLVRAPGFAMEKISVQRPF